MSPAQYSLNRAESWPKALIIHSLHTSAACSVTLHRKFQIQPVRFVSRCNVTVMYPAHTLSDQADTKINLTLVLSAVPLFINLKGVSKEMLEVPMNKDKANIP